MEEKKLIKEELKKTEPDFIVYMPKSLDGSTHDTGNEHLMVFQIDSDTFIAIWTQSTYEGFNDQRIVFAKSDNGPYKWSEPKVIAEPMASWAFPLISKKGRIYVIYSKHIGINDIFTHTTGLMACKYTDDEGKTWSKEKIIKMPRSKWDNPDEKVPPNWIVWQKPERLSDGKYFTGFTRWISPYVRKPAPLKIWWAESSVIEFMEFENIDENPEPEKIEISYYAQNDNALKVPLIGYPDIPVAQEPSIVKLPNSFLFCVMRTTQGSPYWSISPDKGETWTEPLPLLQFDDGPKLKHPCSPCPIYQINENEYIIFIHNHDGYFEKWTPFDTIDHRRPIYICRGKFVKKGKQPIWFSEPKFFMNNDGIRIGYGKGRRDLAMYSSFTKYKGEYILWYPERKFFLLGKKVNLNIFNEKGIEYEWENNIGS